MKTSSFAVSVQWGAGHHYFVATDLDTQHAADLMAKKMQVVTMKTFEKKAGRAPRPHVYLWQRILTPDEKV